MASFFFFLRRLASGTALTGSAAVIAWGATAGTISSSTVVSGSAPSVAWAASAGSVPLTGSSPRVQWAASSGQAVYGGVPVSGDAPALAWSASDGLPTSERRVLGLAPRLQWAASLGVVQGVAATATGTGPGLTWGVEPGLVTGAHVMGGSAPSLLWAGEGGEVVGGGGPDVSGAAPRLRWLVSPGRIEGGSDLACPLSGFYLYHEATGQQLAYVPSLEARQLDLSALGLAEGKHTLGLSVVNAFHIESERATIELVIGDGGVPQHRLVPPTQIMARPDEGGMVVVSWQAVNPTGQHVTPAAYEIALAGDLATVLHTQPAGRRVSFSVGVGPFPHGSTVRLVIRATDGEPDGDRGAWHRVPKVVADAEGPDAPQLAPTPAPRCG